MQRRRSVAHTFEENIAAEKAQAGRASGQAQAGSSDRQATRKDQAATDCISHDPVAFFARLTVPDLVGGQRGADSPAEIPETVSPLFGFQQIAMGLARWGGSGHPVWHSSMPIRAS